MQTVAYDFPWYRYDRNTRHLIQMMMIRAQYGSNVDVPFFETSMASFSAVRHVNRDDAQTATANYTTSLFIADRSYSFIVHHTDEVLFVTSLGNVCGLMFHHYCIHRIVFVA